MFSSFFNYNLSRGLFFLFLTLSLCLVCRPVTATNEEAPIHIAADHMVSTENNSTVIFTGDVDVKQGDLRIRTDKMTVHYAKDNKGESQKVEKLICIGNVEVTRGEWLGTGRKMTYLAQKQQVILTGNAKAWQDQNMVSGSQILYYIDKGRSEVIGGSPGSSGSNNGRVNMTIIQK